MPESYSPEAEQPATTNSMVIPHHNNNNNHDGSIMGRPMPSGASAGPDTASRGASNIHQAPQHHHHHHQQQQQQQHQQMVTSQHHHIIPQHNQSNYLPLYPNKPPMSAASYNNAIMNGVHEKEIVSIYVPNSMVGAIIGKSGSAIKEMISSSGASIKIATALPLVETLPRSEQDSSSSPTPPAQQNQADCISDERATIDDKTSQPESEQESQNDSSKTPKIRHSQFSPNSNNQIRKVTIFGAPESQWTAQFMIYRKVAVETMTNDLSLTAEIQIPSHLAGKIIGKSGATIKRLQKQTRTIIRLTDCRPPESSDSEKDQQQQQQQGDSRVQITGEFNGSQLAQRQIRAIIRDSLLPTKSRSGYFPDLNTPLNAMNQPPYLFNNIPLPYMAGSNAQYPIASSIVSTNHGTNAISRTMSGNHHHNHQMAGAQMYPDASGYLPLYPSKPPMPAYNGTMLEGSHEKEIVSIYVPNSMVGAIIGKSGSAIKEMISSSGASIKIATALPLVETPPKVEPETHSSPSPPPNQDQADCGSDDKVATEEKSQPESVQESQPDSSKTQKRHPLKSTPNVGNHIRKVTIVGTPDAQWSAQYMIYRKIALESMGSDVNLTAEIQVPSQLAGRIIGKSGATIKRLQKQTRTVIRLTDCRPPSQPEDENKSEINDGIDTKDEVAENGSEKESKQQQQQQQPVDSCVQITGDFNGSQLAQRQIRNLIKQSVPLKIEVRLFSKS